MTFSSLSTNTGKSGQQTVKKQGRFLMHSLRSFWWVAVICSVVYGFAGPVFNMLKLDSITASNNYADFDTASLLLESQMSQMISWFRIEGFMPLYFSSVVMAAVIGCVMFFYLQQKKQVNFYHSQPITRTRLFINQYAAGLILNVVPLVLMTSLTFVVVAAYGFSDIIRIGVIVQHILQMILLMLASYSIAVFSGQLAGSMATHMALNAVLHFAVPIAAGIVDLMCSLFFATYNGQPSFTEASLKFSPVCAAFQYIDSISYVPESVVMVTTPMAGSIIAVLMSMTVVLSALSWVLYQKRPGEAAGKALVYRASEPVLKAYLMFVVGLAAGLVFQAVGNRIFFYFAIVSFAILTHMTCEVIIQHDFKAMGKRLSHCAVILVLILAVVGVFRFDLLGYDAFLPEPDEVQKVSFSVSDADLGNYYNTENNFSTDDGVKQGVYDLLYPVVWDQLYRSSDFDGNRSSIEYEYTETASITVQYQLKNGSVHSRVYRSITTDMIAENYEKLYNQQAYRDALYGDILYAVPEDIDSMTINHHQMYERSRNLYQREVESVAVSQVGDIAVTTKPAAQQALSDQIWDAESAYETMNAVLEAYRNDIKDRQFDSLKKPKKHTIQIQVQRQDLNSAYHYYDVPVYEDDTYTLAILDSLGIVDEEWTEYSDALIFRCEPSSEQELRKMLSNAYNHLAEDLKYQDDAENLTVERCLAVMSEEAELIAHISGKNQVSQFLRETSLMSEGGMFVEYDDSHFVLLRYDNHDSNDWQNQLFYKGYVPVQYQ